jgi:hypothetical protein
MRLLNVKKLSIQVKDDEHNYLVNIFKSQLRIILCQFSL